MSVPSIIAHRQTDGSFSVIFCLWNGQPSHHGVILTKHYDTEEKVAALLELGDLINLGPSLGERHLCKRPWPAEVNDYCSASGRDGGQTDGEARTGADWDAMKEFAAECQAKWIYTFEGGFWYMMPMQDGWYVRGRHCDKYEKWGLTGAAWLATVVDYKMPVE